MKAAVLEKLEKLTVKEVPTPVVDDDSVLIKVHACAVCGSDLRIYRSGNSRVKPPQILGHEISGEVVQTGKNVTKVQVGDHVAVGANVPCGECAFCEDGIGNVCQDNYAIGYQYAGGFAEYLLLNRMTMLYGPVHKIPKDADYAEYALAEPLACVLNALEQLQIHMGDTVVIIGCGPIGCMMVPVAKKMGASKVICVEHAPGSFVTYEPQRVSDTSSFWQSMVHDKYMEKDMLIKFYTDDKKEDCDYIADSIDWEANLDPEFKKNHYHEPILAEDEEAMRSKGYIEKWVVYGSADFSAKELTVLPGQTVTIRDAAAYGLIMMQGYGTMNGMNIETPSMIGYDDLTADEMYVCLEAAEKGVTIQNFSKTNPIVMLKHFGPANPDAAKFLK